MKGIRSQIVGKHQSFNCEKFCEPKWIDMHAAKCVLDLNRNYLADSLDFDLNLKTTPTDMIQISYKTD